MEDYIEQTKPRASNLLLSCLCAGANFVGFAAATAVWFVGRGRHNELNWICALQRERTNYGLLICFLEPMV